MRRVLLIAMLWLGGVSGQAKAQGDGCAPVDPNTGGLPPCCDNARTLERAAKIESMMTADYYHEYVVIIDCAYGDVVVNAIGSQSMTHYHTNILTTINALVIHSHPIYTMPSIQDMKVFTEDNVLEFWLIGYDVNTRVWQRCVFKKPSWDALWPAVNVNDLAQKEALLIWQKPGNYYAKINAAQYDLWFNWSLENNVSMVCKAIN